MPASSCPNPLFYQDEWFNGALKCNALGTHDGVSTPPNCNGQVTSLHIVNTSPTKSYRALLPHARRGQVDPASGLHYVDIPPSTDQTVTNTNQLAAFGLEFMLDLAEVQLVEV